MPTDSSEYVLYAAIAGVALFLAALLYAAWQDHLVERDKS